MSYFKYILKGFKSNISRLLAIVAIITLGIGFLVGLSTSSKDIRASVNDMYTKSEVMDLNLKSTIGFSKETVTLLNDRADMEAMGVYQLEPKQSFVNNTVKVKSRLISSNLQSSKMNKLELIEGRMPTNDRECVVLKDMGVYYKAKLNDSIRVKDEKTGIDKSYEVVGVVKSPLFFAKDKEYNLTATNTLDLIFFVDDEYNDFDTITDIYVRTNISSDRFSGFYFDELKEYENTLEEMKLTILDSSRNAIKDSIKDEIIADEAGYNELKATVDNEIKKEIRAEALKEENYNELKATVDNEIKASIKKGINEDNEAKAKLEASVKEAMLPPLKEQFTTDPQFKSFLDMAKNQGIANHKKAIKEELMVTNPNVTAEEVDLEYSKRSEEEKQSYINASIDVYVNLAYDLADPNNPDTLEMLKPLVEEKKKAYDKALVEATEQAFKDMPMADKEKLYTEALDTLVIKAFDDMDPLKKEEAYDKALVEAADKIYIDDILAGNEEELYVLNLKANQSYVSVRENSKKIDKIAVIFPVFFYFIAALVALTTITRLVNEERGAIGLFKSLGFSKGKILSKYLIFAVVCSVVGSLLGNLAGVYGLPYVVFQAYKTILDLPPIVYTVEGLINGISIGMMILTVMGVATYVTLNTLREKPAELLMPKAPKPGKRLLLERWKGLWKRISFKYKNTLRNIFRYKKNLAMMMVGVGGCVALLVTAFGIRDAFDKLASVQYDKIVEYDIRVNVDMGTALPDEIMSNASDSRRILGVVTHIEGDDDYDYAINLGIANNDLDNFFNFSHNGKKVEFTNGSVLIDEQIAREFKLKVGSEFKLENSDKTYTVTGIFENHMDNFIFIYDDRLLDSEANTYLINLKDGVDEGKIVDDLALENVTGVESTSQKRDSFNTMLGSIVLILVVVIICSGALAIIVIYNLTNININERFKEIATLKVLGYQNREVYGYIYREIFILTIFGILLGFLIGPFLYKFVMLNLNEPGLFLPMSVHPLNYLYSFLLTLLFAFIVDLILIHKIKSIKMVESLKCVD